MRIRKHLTIALLAVAAAATASAAGLSRYKGWGSSPEAYFLSQAERAKWDAITSDEDAEKFIAAYKAARGKGFEAAIRSRIDYADKNFKLGKKKGSETLRGRTLIILGPPTRVVDGASASGTSKVDPTGGDLAALGGAAGAGKGSGSGSGSVGNAHSNAGGPGADSLRGLQPVSRTISQDWVYDASAVPPALKTSSLKIAFTVEPDEGKEEAAEPQKLEQMLNAVVEYWKPKS